MTDEPEQPECNVPDCTGVATRKLGMCRRCAAEARRRIRVGQITEDELIRRGWMNPPENESAVAKALRKEGER